VEISSLFVVSTLSSYKTYATRTKNNLLLRSILENTPGFVVVKDRQGRHIAVNLNMANFFGKPIEDIIGKDDSE
jgi:PAS domain-containing protein